MSIIHHETTIVPPAAKAFGVSDVNSARRAIRS